MSLATRHTSPSLLARLVSEERSERRDDGNKSGIHEVLDHCLNLFVSGGCFLVEQVAVFANHAAAEWRLHEFAHTEAFTHAQSGFAACPLATCTVSQRPGVAFAITSRLHEIAQRAARTRDDDEVTVGSHCTSAVKPNNFTI